ncbi:MAG: MFS transporter [Clostridiales bacterium]|jgi:MFS family permease|nr:MFS transporter [Eubacteriales bacterium]MDH7567250.1 MFS transporter [Clostridiales bacterium]
MEEANIITGSIQTGAKDRLWTKYFIEAMIVGFLMNMCNNIHMSTLPLYAIHIGGDRSSGGLLTGVFSISALLFRPLVGNLLDSRGRKIVLTAGIVLFALSSLSYDFTYVVWLLLLFRFIHGIGFSAQSTSVGTIVSDIVPKSRIMEGIGFFGLSGVLATAVGPALGLYIIGVAGYRVLYTVTFGISVLALILAYFINYEQESGTSLDLRQKPSALKEGETSDVSREGQKAVLFEKTAVVPSFVMLFAALAMASITSFIPSYAISRNVNNIGIFFTVYAAALMVVRPFSGKLSDRYGATRIILPGMAFMIISMVMIAFSATLPSFLIAAVLYGFGSGTVNPVLNAITVKLCPPDRRGAANATFFSSMDIGMGVGSIMWGFIAQNMGFRYIYLGSAACVVISVFLYLLLLRKRLQVSG